MKNYNICVMNTTINISLPTSMYRDIKAVMKREGYASVSEFMRAVVRTKMYPRITENGFTPEFEEEVLQAEAEPIDEDKVWETPEDIHAYFQQLKKELAHDSR